MIIAALGSPIILFFVPGMFAGFARSDLAIPEALAKRRSNRIMERRWLSPLLDSHRLLLTIGDVDVIRGDRF